MLSQESAGRPLYQSEEMRELVVIAAVLILLGGCAARESDDIVKLRLTQEFAKDERTFHECADWARESLGEDASAAEQMELTNSCLHMQTDLQDREADIKDKEAELESAKRELLEARRKIEDARRKREAERERELEETKRQLEEEKRKREAAEQEHAQANLPDDEELAALNNRVVELLKQGEYAEALPLAKKVLRLTEQQKGRNHTDTAIALHNLAGAYLKQDDHASAAPLFRRALTIYEMTYGKDNPRLVTTLDNLAEAYDKQGKYLLALSLYQRKLEIQEGWLGKDHPDVASTLLRMAGPHISMGVIAQSRQTSRREFSSAAALAKRALAISEAAFGKDDPRVAIALTQLSTAHNALGDTSSAAALMSRALAIREAAYGKDSPEAEVSRTILELINKKDKTDSAPAEKSDNSTSSAKELDIISEEIDTLLRQGEYAKSIPLLKKAIRLFEQEYGHDNPVTGTFLSLLGASYLQTNKHYAAVSAYLRALKILDTKQAKDAFGSDKHKSIIRGIHQELTHSREKITEQRRRISDTFNPSEDWHARDIEWQLLSQQEEHAEALPLAKELLRIAKQENEHDHPLTAFSEVRLAVSHANLDDFSPALPLLLHALPILEEKLGTDHSEAIVIRFLLALTYDELGENDKADAVRKGEWPVKE